MNTENPYKAGNLILINEELNNKIQRNIPSK
jgi:hypothetical protein